MKKNDEYQKDRALVRGISIGAILAFIVCSVIFGAFYQNRVESNAKVVQETAITQTQTQTQYKRLATADYRFVVVKSGDCYSIGSDDASGWVVSECYTYDRAKQKTASMNETKAFQRASQLKVWTRVE